MTKVTDAGKQRDERRSRTASLIIALTLERPVCMVCLADKSGAPEATLSEALSAIGEVVAFHSATGRCRSCGDVGLVISVGLRE